MSTNPLAFPSQSASSHDAASVTDVDLIIVGAGAAGIAMAMAAKRQGRSFVVLERAEEIGGMWRDNRYPGVSANSPSHLVAFSDAPNPYWSHQYPSGDEVQDYLLSVVERHGLREHILGGASLAAATYDDSVGHWHVTYESAGYVSELVSTALVLAVGRHHIPNIPMIEGLHYFGGDLVHTAAWPQDVSLFSRRVGVIGTGASAVDCIPALAEDASHLTVFQRTARWVLPRHNTEYRDSTIDRFRQHPNLLRAHRASLALQSQLRSAVGENDRAAQLTARIAHNHLTNQVKDERLRDQLTPTIPPGRNEILRSDEYYPALVRRNVTLVTDGILAVTHDGIVTADETFHPLDAIVLATGFEPHAAYRYLNIQGAQGRSFADEWAEGVQTYLGITMADFPNLFMLAGPNTALDGASETTMIETQVAHICALLDERDSLGAARVSVRPELVTAFTRQMAQRSASFPARLAGSETDGDGVNRSWWPGTLRDYQKRCRTPDFIDYHFD